MEVGERGRRRRRALRYALFQVPGAALVALALVLAVQRWQWSPGWALALLALWVLKDAALYRLVAPAYDSDADSAIDPLIGARGVVTEPLDPAGYVRVGAELWRARARGQSLPRGTAVRVRERRDLTLIVEAEDRPPPAGSRCR